MLKILEPQWLDVAEKFLEKKYHNVSHLKEFGVIFVIPLKIDMPGETLRLFTLILHYLNEVPWPQEGRPRVGPGEKILEGQQPPGFLLQRQQAVVDEAVDRRRHAGFFAETHHGAALFVQFRGAPLHDIALHGGRSLGRHAVDQGKGRRYGLFRDRNAIGPGHGQHLPY